MLHAQAEARAETLTIACAPANVLTYAETRVQAETRVHADEIKKNEKGEGLAEGRVCEIYCQRRRRTWMSAPTWIFTM
jgi:hypothetical protein